MGPYTDLLLEGPTSWGMVTQLYTSISRVESCHPRWKRGKGKQRFNKINSNLYLCHSYQPGLLSLSPMLIGQTWNFCRYRVLASETILSEKKPMAAPRLATDGALGRVVAANPLHGAGTSTRASGQSPRDSSGLCVSV